MRIILFTGKGGVGKTTVACATAHRIAESGRKTLLMSTDPAHSLADSLDMELGPHAVRVTESLWAEQLDPQARLEENWRDIQRHAVNVLRWAGLDEVEAEELSVIPGLDELFGLVDVKTYHDRGEYDVLVVDCAPTGETLRLLSLPDVIQWYMHKIFPVERRLMGALRPVARAVSNLPLPDDSVYDAVQRLYDRLDGVRAVLSDAGTTTVRLVVNPEAMVIAEARRTFTYLSLFGYRVDAVVANRLLPEEVSDPYFARWKELQAGYMDEIEKSFSPAPILKLALQDREVVGLDALERAGRDLYEGDPASVLFEDDPMTVAAVGDAHVLSMRLPFTTRDEVDLSTKGDELFVKVGPYRRTIILPHVLASRDITRAGIVDDRLEIVFERGHP